MKKSVIRTVVVLAILFVVFTVIAFAAPFAHTAVFWMSYGFFVVAVAAQGFTAHAAFAGQASLRSKFYGFPIVKVGFLYLVGQTALSLICMILAAVAPARVVLILDVVALGAAVIGFISTDAMREEIQRQDTALKKDVSAMRALQSSVRMLVGQCDDPQTAADIRRLSEALQYSDPVSSDALTEIEAELASMVAELQKAVVDRAFDAARELCKKTAAMLEERNRLCKLHK